MSDEEIIEVLPSIGIACLFYAYGRLDELQEAGYHEANCEFYEMFWELIDATADFTDYDFDETWNMGRWYFSFEAMVEYYRLCRTYSRLRGVKLKDNPYMQDAQRFVESAMDFNGQCGFGWHLNTGINHKWASGIVFRTDDYFNGEYELLEALLSIGNWYERQLERLRSVIEAEKRAVGALPEVMAA